MISKLTAQQCDDLIGYGDGEARVMREMNCTAAELREAALNAGVEQCPTCHWWAESHEMLNDTQEVDKHCTNCRIGDI